MEFNADARESQSLLTPPHPTSSSVNFDDYLVDDESLDDEPGIDFVSSVFTHHIQQVTNNNNNNNSNNNMNDNNHININTPLHSNGNNYTTLNITSRFENLQNT